MITKQKITLAILTPLVILAGVLYFNTTFKVGAVTGNTSGEPVDLVGTRVGTTTTGVGFYTKNTATSTYPFRIGADTDEVSFFISPRAASSTANITFNVLASNDYNCDTATTSTIYDIPIKSQINWYDAAESLLGNTNTATIANATTTFVYTNPLVQANKQISFKATNARCMSLEMSASSTIVHVQFTTK